MHWQTNPDLRIRFLTLPHGWVVDVIGGGTCFVPHPIRIEEDEEVKIIKEIEKCLSK